jgi:hypothetical protein
LHFPEDTRTHTRLGGIRTAGRTGRHRLDVGIISGKNKISDRKEKELGRRRLGKLVANERQCRWTLLNEQGIVAGTTTTAGIGSRLDGKQRRGHDDDGSQRSRTDSMKTSTGKPPPSFSFFFFFSQTKTSAKSFAYRNRFLPSSPLSGRLTLKDAKLKTAKRARNFKFTHQSIPP